MSTTTPRPPMTVEELEDVRWLAREALVRATCKGIGGETLEEDMHEVMTLMHRAWAVGAAGMEFNDDVPGTRWERGDAERWPLALTAEHTRTLLDGADDLEDLYRAGLHDADNPDQREAFYGSRVERIRRARAVLAKGVAAPGGGDPA